MLTVNRYFDSVLKKTKINADSQPFFNLLVLVLMIFCIEQYI